MAMETGRWLNPRQPQTLQIAVFLFYFDAVFIALRGGLFAPLGIVFIAAYIGAAWGIVNERRWGYGLAIAVAAFGLLPYVLFVSRGGNILGGDPLGLMFAIAKVALLLHPMSRSYQRIWFK